MSSNCIVLCKEHAMSLCQTTLVLVPYTDATQDGDSSLFGGSSLAFGGLGSRGPSGTTTANPFGGGGGGIASATPLAGSRGPFPSSSSGGGLLKPSALGN